MARYGVLRRRRAQSLAYGPGFRKPDQVSTDRAHDIIIHSFGGYQGRSGLMMYQDFKRHQQQIEKLYRGIRTPVSISIGTWDTFGSHGEDEVGRYYELYGTNDGEETSSMNATISNDLYYDVSVHAHFKIMDSDASGVGSILGWHDYFYSTSDAFFSLLYSTTSNTLYWGMASVTNGWEGTISHVQDLEDKREHFVIGTTNRNGSALYLDGKQVAFSSSINSSAGGVDYSYLSGTAINWGSWNNAQSMKLRYYNYGVWNAYIRPDQAQMLYECRGDLSQQFGHNIAMFDTSTKVNANDASHAHSADNVTLCPGAVPTLSDPGVTDVEPTQVTPYVTTTFS